MYSGQKLKQSIYNIEIPLKNGKYLVFNSISELVLLINDDERTKFFSHNRLIDPNNTNIGDQALRSMRHSGFLIEENCEERNLVDERYERNRSLSKYMAITIAPTLGCNLACGYCFQGQNKPSNKMTDQTRDGLLDYVRSSADELSNLSIVWYGGEPLMNQTEVWRTSTALAELSQKHDFKLSFSMITNGYLLTKEVANKLLECGVRNAQITIDGSKDSHDRMRPSLAGRGSYDRIMANLLKVVFETDLSISLRISVDVENETGIRELLYSLKNDGLSNRSNFSVYFAPIEAISEGCSGYESLSMSKRDYARLEVDLIDLATSLGFMKLGRFGQDLSMCQAVRPSDLVISPNGDIHKCWDTISYDKMKIANISDKNVRDAIYNNKWTKWKASQNEICSNCKILPICGGGCAFKTVHTDQQHGEAAQLPCISLKFNLAERVFRSSVAAGIVSDDDWDADMSPTLANNSSKTGESHYTGSIIERMKSAEPANVF